jgi:hypothetical protein
MKRTSLGPVWMWVILAFGMLECLPGVSAQSSDSFTIKTVVGTGVAGYNGDGGRGTATQISGVRFITADSEGNVYFSDTGNNRVRKLSVSGIVSTVAGTGRDAYRGDGGPAFAADISRPLGIAVNSSGNLCFVDAGNIHIRKISISGTMTLLTLDRLIYPGTCTSLKSTIGAYVELIEPASSPRSWAKARRATTGTTYLPRRRESQTQWRLL